jgi:hypothetical protein
MTNGKISISPSSTFLTYEANANIPISPAYGVYMSQLIPYARACVTYDQFQIQDGLLTNKLMSQRFLQSHFYGHYKDLICKHNLPLHQMLSDIFIQIVKLFSIHRSTLRFRLFTWIGIRAHDLCDRSTGHVYSFEAPDPTSGISRGPCMLHPQMCNSNRTYWWLFVILLFHGVILPDGYIDTWFIIFIGIDVACAFLRDVYCYTEI